MPNEIWWFLFLIIDFGLSLLAIYFFGKKALYVIIAADIIVCNIQVIKTIEIFGFVATLGNILYGSIFLATDLLSELYGKKEARKGVWLGFYALIFMTIAMQFAIQFTPHPSDFSHQAMQTIFGFLPRVTLASLLAYLISQNHDVWAFHFWKDKTRGKHLWLRNNASTWISQAIDSLVFVLVAFYGIFDTSTLLSILLTTYVIKVLVAIFDTPVIYAGKWVMKKHQQRFESNL
ncbi:MAG: queuosine precursor transporter [bacterium]|nr:MAG: queuosine precursor transporter [bacterium]